MAVFATMLLAACGAGDKPGDKTPVEAKPAATAASTGKGESHGDADGLKLSAEDVQRAGIKLEELKLQALADAVTVTATIRPNQDRMARIAPRVEGRVSSVQVSLGDTVRAGQTLAVLDSFGGWRGFNCADPGSISRSRGRERLQARGGPQRGGNHSPEGISARQVRA